MKLFVTGVVMFNVQLNLR